MESEVPATMRAPSLCIEVGNDGQEPTFVFATTPIPIKIIDVGGICTPISTIDGQHSISAFTQDERSVLSTGIVGFMC
jgi:hypothetical protein